MKKKSNRAPAATKAKAGKKALPAGRQELLGERTVMLVKPDGVKRGLVGECIKRIEQRGLKLIAMKMVQATPEHAREHYPGSEPWLRGMGDKTLESYKKYGKDAQ